MMEFSSATKKEYIIRNLFQKGDRVLYEGRTGTVINVHQEPALIWWIVLFDGETEPTRLWVLDSQNPETVRIHLAKGE